MNVLKKEAVVVNHPKLSIITGGKDTGDWLSGLPNGQWFLCRHNNDDDIQLWMKKFTFKTSVLLYTNINMEFRKIVNPKKFSETHVLVEALDLEE